MGHRHTPSGLLVAASILFASAAVTAGVASGAPTPTKQVARQRTGLQVELIEQDFTFRPGASIRLVYRITGDLDAGGITPPTTSTSTSTSTSTVPTTSPAATVPIDPAPPPGTTKPATTASPTTTTTTVTPIPALTVDIANFEALTSADSSVFDQILGQGAQPGAFRNNIDGVRFADVRNQIDILTSTEAVLTVDIPTDTGGDEVLSGPDSLEFPDPGFTPIRMQLLIDNDLVATHGTIIERKPGTDETQRPAEPVTLGLVAEVSRSNGSLTDAQATQNEIVTLIGVAAQLTPPILAAVPPGAVSALADPEAAAAAFDNDEITTHTDVELDVSSAVAAGVPDVFTRALNAGEDIVTDVLRQTPTRVVWIASKPLSSGGAQLLRDLGVRYVVMTPELYATTISENVPDTDRLVELPLPDGGNMPVLLVDQLGASLTTDVGDAVLAEQTAVEWAVRMATELVLDHRENGRNVRRTRLLAGPDLTAPDPRLVNALADIAELTPDLRFAAPSTLIGSTDVQRLRSSVVTFPDVAGPDLTARLQRINNAKLSLTSVGSMLATDGGPTTAWFETLDRLVATSVTDNAANTQIDDVLQEARRIQTAVVLPDPFTFTLTGKADEITIRLGNTSNDPLTVILQMSSSKLTFPDNDQLITLRPNDSTDVRVPVRARSNGTSAVNVALLTPLGDPLGEPVVLTSRVNALTGLGQVLTGAFIIMLGSWWFANWRKRRGVNSDAGPDNGDASARATNLSSS